jgi:hypothetical protein
VRVFVRTVMFGELASHRPVKAAQELPQETLSAPFITVGPSVFVRTLVFEEQSVTSAY